MGTNKEQVIIEVNAETADAKKSIDDLTQTQKAASQASQLMYSNSLKLLQGITTASGKVKTSMTAVHKEHSELIELLNNTAKGGTEENPIVMTFTEIATAVQKTQLYVRQFHKEIAEGTKGFDVGINIAKIEKDFSSFKNTVRGISDMQLVSPENTKSLQSTIYLMNELEKDTKDLYAQYEKASSATEKSQIAIQLKANQEMIKSNITYLGSLKNSYTQAMSASTDSSKIEAVFTKLNTSMQSYIDTAGTAKVQLDSFMSGFQKTALTNHIKEIRSYTTKLNNLQKTAVPKGDVGYDEYKKEFDRLTKLIDSKVKSYNTELSKIGNVKIDTLKDIGDDVSFDKITNEVLKLQKEILKLNSIPLVNQEAANAKVSEAANAKAASESMASSIAMENKALNELDTTLGTLIGEYKRLQESKSQGVNVDKELAEANALLQKTANQINTAKNNYLEYNTVVSKSDKLITKANADTVNEFESIITSQKKATEGLRQFVNTRSKLANDSAIEDATNSINRYESSIETLNKTAKEQQAIIQQTGARIAEASEKYKQAMLQYKKTGGEGVKEQKVLQEQLRVIRQEEALLEKQLADKNKILATSRTATKNYSQEISKLKANLAETSGIKRFADIIKRTAMYITGGSIFFEMIAAGKAVAAFTVEADKAARTLSAVLDLQGDVNERFAEAVIIEEKLINLTKQYGGTLEDVNSAALELGRAGIPVDKLESATEAVIKMAKLTGDTIGTSASAMVTYTSVFNNLDVDTLGDKLAYVANQSRMSTQDIGTFSNYALATAKTVGLTIDAINGMAIAFSNAGFNASTSGTQIRKFANILNDTSSDTQKFFMDIGTNQSMLAFNIAKGGEESNKAFMEFVKNLQTKTRPEFNKAVAGMDILVKNVLSGLYENGDNVIKSLTGSITDSVGELDKSIIVTESYLATWEKFKVVMMDFGSTILTPLFKVMQAFAQVIVDNEDAIKRTIVVLGIGAAAWGTYKVAVMALAPVMALANTHLLLTHKRMGMVAAASTLLTGAYLKLAITVTAFARAAKLAAVALLANPIGVAIAAVATLASGIYLLTEAYDGQIETLGELEEAYNDVYEVQNVAMNNIGAFDSTQLQERIKQLEKYKDIAKKIVEDDSSTGSEKLDAIKQLEALNKAIDSSIAVFERLKETTKELEISKKFDESVLTLGNTLHALVTQKEYAVKINPEFVTTDIDKQIAAVQAKIDEATNRFNNRAISTTSNDVDAMKEYTTMINNIANSTSSSYENAILKFDKVKESIKTTGDVLAKELNPRFTKLKELLEESEMSSALQDNVKSLFTTMSKGDLGLAATQIQDMRKEIEDLAKSKPDWNPTGADAAVKILRNLTEMYAILGATEASINKKALAATKAHIKGIYDRVTLTNELAKAKALAEGTEYKESDGLKADLDASNKILASLKSQKDTKGQQTLIDEEQKKNYLLIAAHNKAINSEKNKELALTNSIQVILNQLRGEEQTSLVLAKSKQDTLEKQALAMLDLKDTEYSIKELAGLNEEQLTAKLAKGSSYLKVMEAIKAALAAELATEKAINAEKSKYAALDQKRIEQHTAYVASQKQSLEATKEQYNQLFAFSEIEKERAAAQAAYNKAMTKAATERDKEVDRIEQRIKAINESNAEELEKEKSLAELKKQKERAEELYGKQLKESGKLLDENLERADEFYKLMETGIDSLTNGLDDFFDISSDGWMDFGSLAEGVLSDVQKKMTQLTITDPLNSAMSSMLSGASLGVGGSALAAAGITGMSSLSNGGSAQEAIAGAAGVGLSSYGAMISTFNPVVGIPMVIGGAVLGNVLGGIGGGGDTTTADQLQALNDKAEARNRYLEAAQSFYDASGSLGSAFATAFESAMLGFNTTMEGLLLDNEAYRINASDGSFAGDKLLNMEFGSASDTLNFFIEGLERTIEGTKGFIYAVDELDVTMSTGGASAKEYVLAWEDLDSSGNMALKSLGQAMIDLGTNAYSAATALSTVFSDYQDMYETLTGSTEFSDADLTNAQDKLLKAGAIDDTSIESFAALLYEIGSAADAANVNLADLTESIEENLQSAIEANPELQELRNNEADAQESIDILRANGFPELASDIDKLNTIMKNTAGATGKTLQELLDLNPEIVTMYKALTISEANIQSWEDSLKTSSELMLESSKDFGVAGLSSAEAFNVLKDNSGGLADDLTDLTDAELNYLTSIKAHEDALEDWFNRNDSAVDSVVDLAKETGILEAAYMSLADIQTAAIANGDGITIAELELLAAREAMIIAIQNNNASIYGMLDTLNDMANEDGDSKSTLAADYQLEVAAKSVGLSKEDLDSKEEIRKYLEGNLLLEKDLQAFREMSYDEQVAAFSETQKAELAKEQAILDADYERKLAEVISQQGLIDSNYVLQMAIHNLSGVLANGFDDVFDEPTPVHITLELPEQEKAQPVTIIADTSQATSVGNAALHALQAGGDENSAHLESIKYTQDLLNAEALKMSQSMGELSDSMRGGRTTEENIKAILDAYGRGDDFVEAKALEAKDLLSGVMSWISGRGWEYSHSTSTTGIGIAGNEYTSSQSWFKAKDVILDFVDDFNAEGMSLAEVVAEIAEGQIEYRNFLDQDLAYNSPFTGYDKTGTIINDTEGVDWNTYDNQGINYHLRDNQDNLVEMMDTFVALANLDPEFEPLLQQLDLAILGLDGMEGFAELLTSSSEAFDINDMESMHTALGLSEDQLASFTRLLETEFNGTIDDTIGLLEQLYGVSTAEFDLLKFKDSISQKVIGDNGLEGEDFVLNKAIENLGPVPDTAEDLAELYATFRESDDQIDEFEQAILSAGVAALEASEAVEDLTNQWNQRNETESQTIDRMGSDLGIDSASTASVADLESIVMTDGLTQAEYDLLAAREAQIQASEANIASWTDTIAPDGTMQRLADSIGILSDVSDMSIDTLYDLAMADGELSDEELRLLNLRKDQIDADQEKLDSLQDQLDIAKLMGNEEAILAETRKQALEGLTDEQKALQENIWAEEDALEIFNEKKGLQDQLNQLILSEDELRAIQLATLDESNQALQENIWAEEDRQKSLANINSWLDTIDFEGYVGSFGRLAESLGLSDVSANMSSDAMFDMFMVDGELTDAELALLNARKAQEDVTADLAQQEEDERIAKMDTTWDAYYDRLIREADEAHQAVIDGYNREIDAYEDTIDSKEEMLDGLNDSVSDIVDNINTLDGLIDSIGDTIKDLRGENEGLQQLANFDSYINEALRLSGSSKYDELSDAVEDAISASSSLLDSSNFSSLEDMLYKQSVAANQFDDLDITLQSERDILEEIEENTRMQIAAIEGSIYSLRNAISSLSDSIELKEEEATTSEMVADLTQTFNDMKSTREIIKEANDLQFLSPVDIEKYTDAQTANWFRDKFDEINEIAQALIPILGDSYSIKAFDGIERSLETLAYALGTSTDPSIANPETTEEKLARLEDDFLEMKSLREVIKAANDLQFLSPVDIAKYSDASTATWFENMFDSINSQAQSLIPTLGADFGIDTIYGTKVLEALAYALGTSTATSIKLDGFSSGGYTGDVPINNIAGIVHGQEYVIDAPTTKSMGLNSGGENVFIEIKNILAEVRQMQVRQTANSNKSLDNQRASLSLQLKEA